MCINFTAIGLLLRIKKSVIADQLRDAFVCTCNGLVDHPKTRPFLKVYVNLAVVRWK